MKVCLEPGCPTLTERSRCAEHERAKDRARGTPAERGYDAEHRALRASFVPLVRTGLVKCWRCRELIGADEPWDLGHEDGNRSRHRGPECLPCNRATSGRS